MLYPGYRYIKRRKERLKYVYLPQKRKGIFKSQYHQKIIGIDLINLVPKRLVYDQEDLTL